MFNGIITVLIADDEEPARKRLKTLLSDYSMFKIISETENGDQVVSEIIHSQPQVAFLDINMPGASVFNTIPSLRNPPLIIFQTAYSEYGAKAFDLSAVDYLLKPISRERFKLAIDKILSVLNRHIVDDNVYMNTPKEFISVKSGETIKIVKINIIFRISFEDGFSFIHTATDKLFSDRSLNYFEGSLESVGFYRISRTDIINLSFISKLHPLFNGLYIVELLNGEKLNISRRRIHKLKELIS